MGLEPSRIWHIHIVGFESQQNLVASLVERVFLTEVLQHLLQRFGAQRDYFHQSRPNSLEEVVTLVSSRLT
jgi:hypothetical protein